MASMTSFAQETAENILKTGCVKPISYLFNGVEQIDTIQYMFIECFEDTDYRDYGITIVYTRDYAHYYNFVANFEKNTEKILESELYSISKNEERTLGGYKNVTIFSDTEDELADMRIVLENNVVTMEIVTPDGKNYKIVWENHKLDDQSFVKIGEECEFLLDYDKEWKFSINPSKGFTFSRQSNIDEADEPIQDFDGRQYIKYGRKNVSTKFVFIAQKIGKYKLTFDNGVKQYKCEITVTKK